MPLLKKLKKINIRWQMIAVAASLLVPQAYAHTINKDPYPSTYSPESSQLIAITNATVLTGAGEQIDNASILMNKGKIIGLGNNIQIPSNAKRIDGTGKWLTPGIIDAHSHLGLFSSPNHKSQKEGNEWTKPVTPEVWAEHSIWPQAPEFSRALEGGITTMLVLPGSANLFGGRGVTIKNVPSISREGMKFPNAPYSIKMACGENPKRTYGNKGGPKTSMGNMAGYRKAWQDAKAYQQKWQNYEQALKAGKKATPPARNVALDTLVGVLDNEILVHIHCYRADEMNSMINLSKEFDYKITAFHHAVESYKIANTLAKENICSAMWADWWGFKMESFDAIDENVPMVASQGACAVVHSDSAAQVQKLNQEAAKAWADGNKVGLNISKAQAFSWLTLNAAKILGIDKVTGSLEKGKNADVVLWSGDPFSSYSLTEQVYIDGNLMFDRKSNFNIIQSDFELGINE
ncbi:amidohydrolase [Parashewanella curva]|uniref:Amidohydrolase n=2 Tax=Parashewanella curva TaxID=2338552 RepID=A0A3L8PU21_9GAMM|nr:amidohydrolase [Parashewanella curva]